MSKNSVNRRDFFRSAAVVGAAGTLGAGTILNSCGGPKEPVLVPLASLANAYIPELTDYANDGKPLKAGLIGCGGRATGAAVNFLSAGPNLQIVALGDLFMDRIDGCRKTLREKFKMEVPDDKCFTGFDNYKKVLASDIDLVIIATPPAFRPTHFEAAVEAGKHVFMEKPVCVDGPGARSIMATAKKAESQGLVVVTGTQRHHQRKYVESFQQIQKGLIGEIVSGCVYWNQSMLWYRNRENGWSDMEWMVRDWVNWKWLSGDHIVEQHVHNLDVFNWFTGKKPVKAVGFGARQRRLTGDQYDMFSIDYEYEGGIHLHSMCRQIDGCANNVSEFIQGTKGSWTSAGAENNHEIRDLSGNIIWKTDVAKEKAEHKQTDPYTLEHVDFINHIRAGKPLNQAVETAISCITAMMGRESAYTGKAVTYDEVYNSAVNFIPEKLELGAYDMKAYAVPVPGKPKEEK
ncbi:MAG: Gfo/Idh/MocA family oxidoreductase [Marinilabiliales bacterium]|nr:Gfo/Idh/MocA family oxidoreductase [Marinilabiliales bacterium]